MRDEVSTTLLPEAPAAGVEREPPRAKVWPLVALCGVFAIFDVAFIRGELPLENGETERFLVLAAVLPQLSLGVAWLALSRRRPRDRIGAALLAAFICVRFGPGNLWLVDVLSRMIHQQWLLALWTQIAIVGATLRVARRHGLSLTDGASPAAGEALVGRLRSFASDLTWLAWLLMVSWMLADFFLISQYEPFSWRMTALGGAFAIEALLALWSVLGCGELPLRILAPPACAWALGRGLEIAFGADSLGAPIVPASLAHMVALLASLALARASGFRFAAIGAVGGAFGVSESRSTFAAFGRSLCAGSLVAAVATAAFAIDDQTAFIAGTAGTARFALLANVCTLALIWVWLPSAPVVSRAMLFGLCLYCMRPAFSSAVEFMDFVILLLPLSAPLIYLRRGRIRLTMDNQHEGEIRFVSLPQASLRDYFGLTAVFGLTTLLLQLGASEFTRHDIVLSLIVVVALPLLALATLRAEFGPRRSWSWHGLRLLAPVCAALSLAAAASVIGGYPLQFALLFVIAAILFYAYAIVLSISLFLLRLIGFRLIVQAPPNELDSIAPTRLPSARGATE